MSALIETCDGCLRRGHLIAHLAPRIAGLLDRPAGRVPGLLALSDEELIEAATGVGGEDDAFAFLERFQAAPARDHLARAGVMALCTHAQSYPPLLLELADPPAVLFGVGREAALGALRAEPAVAIVGTRRASAYGAEVAYALGRGLGAAGVPVVSGLALGIDGHAHRGCVAGSGVPIAVLACGPDLAYPRRHRGLHESVARAGLVLSELPPGAEPFRWSFPARNRIMAGLSQLTVVVEAADPSGSLITSDFARDLGRSVAAVPGRITSSLARGTNGLLRDGAAPVTGTEDVLDQLFGAGAGRGRIVPPPEPADPLLRAVLAAVENSSSAGSIATAASVTVAEARAALGRLEREGHLVRREPGAWERAAW